VNSSTVLIVDDTPGNLGMAVTLLEGRGYRVAIAQDGEEGLQRAKLLRPDLILLDVMMPGADGFEICTRLKALDETHNIPVIFMTALASTEDKVKGFAAGGVDYVTKP
jgi:CheY-like chemotaxis protein